mmetsp:Transcript_174228/g.553130  ORF Transcript_174228/g.553130 Transcript_174228/m.553130 type:complete len:209 (+) Transcript_174228:43-669(+)
MHGLEDTRGGHNLMPTIGPRNLNGRARASAGPAMRSWHLNSPAFCHTVPGTYHTRPSGTCVNNSGACTIECGAIPIAGSKCGPSRGQHPAIQIAGYNCWYEAVAPAGITQDNTVPAGLKTTFPYNQHQKISDMTLPTTLQVQFCHNGTADPIQGDGKMPHNGGGTTPQRLNCATERHVTATSCSTTLALSATMIEASSNHRIARFAGQ